MITKQIFKNILEFFMNLMNYLKILYNHPILILCNDHANYNRSNSRKDSKTFHGSWNQINLISSTIAEILSLVSNIISSIFLDDSGSISYNTRHHK